MITATRRSPNTGIVPPYMQQRTPAAPACNTGIVPPNILEKIGHAGDQFDGVTGQPANGGIVPPWLAPLGNTGIVPPQILKEIGQLFSELESVFWN
jgi:hypothetical protein